MLTTMHPSAAAQKKDLHIGGLGSGKSNPSGALAAITRPPDDVDESWVVRARGAAEYADELVRVNPWSALAVAAVVGIAAGFLLSRQT